MKVGLDEAVLEYIAALKAYREAKERLEAELRNLGLGRKAIETFVRSLTKNAEEAEKRALEGKPLPGAPAKEPKAEEKQDTAPAKEPPAEKKKRPRRRKTQPRAVNLNEGEFVFAEGRYTYRLDGKLKSGKYLPLFRFRKTILSFHDGDEYGLLTIGKGGRSKIHEGLAMAQVRTLLRELETDEVEPDEVEVYEPFIKGVLHRMRPVARELMKQLLESWKAYKARRAS